MVSCQVYKENGGLFYDYVGRYFDPPSYTQFTKAEILQHYKIEDNGIWIITTGELGKQYTVAGAWGPAHDTPLIQGFGSPWSASVAGGRPILGLV
ncbi:MAG: hypothetical protein QW757_05800, partial [Candidatus Woesearchaeota archaeon]